MKTVEQLKDQFDLKPEGFSSGFGEQLVYGSWNWILHIDEEESGYHIVMRKVFSEEDLVSAATWVSKEEVEEPFVKVVDEEFAWSFIGLCLDKQYFGEMLIEGEFDGLTVLEAKVKMLKYMINNSYETSREKQNYISKLHKS